MLSNDGVDPVPKLQLTAETAPTWLTFRPIMFHGGRLRSESLLP